MTDATLRQALAYARHGWPVFPCLPGQKIPATRHGYRDATTDPQQITDWFGRGFALEPGHRHRRPRPRRPGHRPARPRRKRLRRLHQAPPRRTGRRRRRLRPDPGRRNARLLHRLRPAQWPPAPPSPGLPLPRRIHRRPALPGRRQPLPTHRQARRPRQPELGRGHAASWSPRSNRTACNRARLAAST